MGWIGDDAWGGSPRTVFLLALSVSTGYKMYCQYLFYLLLLLALERDPGEVLMAILHYLNE